MRRGLVFFSGFVALAVAGLVATATAPAASTLTLPVYFFHNGALTPVPVKTTKAATVAESALNALLAGAPRGYTTAIPSGTRLLGVTFSGGVATANFSSTLATPPRVTQAQIVTTLVKIGAKRVFVQVNGKPVELERGDGELLTHGARRTDYWDLMPDAAIFVAAPVRGATVSSPARVSGTAESFEATIELEILTGSTVADHKTIASTAGAGTRGNWSTTLSLPPGEVTLVFFQTSLTDGRRIHVTRVPVHVR